MQDNIEDFIQSEVDTVRRLFNLDEVWAQTFCRLLTLPILKYKC